MKIKFNSDDDLPLNKPLKFHAMTKIIRSVFEENGKLYPRVFLDDTLYKLRIKKIRYVSKKTLVTSDVELIFQKELMLMKQVHQRNAIFVTIDILSMNHIFAMVIMI